MNLRHLLRMKRWARHPPSAWRVALVFGIVGFCLVLAGAEVLGLLPDFASFPPRQKFP